MAEIMFSGIIAIIVLCALVVVLELRSGASFADATRSECNTRCEEGSTPAKLEHAGL